MFRKYPHLIVFLLLLFSFFQVSGCKEKISAREDQCSIQEQSCLLLKSGPLEVQFQNEHLYAEQLYPFTITTERAIDSVYLIGINMNMGKIPVVIEKVGQKYEGSLFLGLCSEPVMHWELVVRFKDNQQLSFQVTSYWNEEAFLDSQ